MYACSSTINHYSKSFFNYLPQPPATPAQPIDTSRGVIPEGARGVGQPPNFWPTTLFSGFSHTTDRKVPSEVVLLGSFSTELVRSYVSHMVMSDKAAIFQFKSQ